jgi:hypothetical protein
MFFEGVIVRGIILMSYKKPRITYEKVSPII